MKMAERANSLALLVHRNTASSIYEQPPPPRYGLL